MKRNLTEIVFILDASGSMHSLAADVIGGFNSTLDEQREVKGECLVSTVLFNSRSRILHDRVPLESVKPMGKGDYVAGGMTALYDSVGDAINRISTVHKYAREEDRPDRTLVIITTDGHENASKIYTAGVIKRMIEEKRAAGWEFIFLGANIDAEAAAQSIGIDETRVGSYEATSEGVDRCYRRMSSAIRRVRADGNINDSSWRDEE